MREGAEYRADWEARWSDAEFVGAMVIGSARVDRPDGLVIVGDGAQRIYPGGYTLRPAGIEVRSRTKVLRVNYRNTREVIGAAMAVAGGGDVDDLGDEYRRGDAASDAARAGLRPTLIQTGSEGKFPAIPTGVKDVDERREHEERSLSQLFVALTRARDQLVVTCTGDPADAIIAALDQFDIQPP